MYQQMIQRATGCSEAEAGEVEEIMRHDIFHSTLDWQTRAIFDKAARMAVAYLHGTAPERVVRAIECGVPVRV